MELYLFFFFSSRRRHTRFDCDWSSDVCSSDLAGGTDQRAERDGGGRRCPTARASLRRVPHVRRRAATPAAGVARGVGGRPADGERGAAGGQSVEGRAPGSRAAAARAGGGAVAAQTE